MSPQHALGQILRDEQGVSLRYERHLSHPPVRVWRALTESDQLRHWFPADLVGPRDEGAELVVPFWDDVAAKFSIEDPVLTGRILTWDPPSRFAWQWDDEVITFELEPTDQGTRLTLHVQLSATGPGADQVGAGYHLCLDQLVTLVETDTAPPFVDLDENTYVADYAASDAASG
jgi:uncharacterized protein YndB with AHSA1/START domain